MSNDNLPPLSATLRNTYSSLTERCHERLVQEYGQACFALGRAASVRDYVSPIEQRDAVAASGAGVPDARGYLLIAADGHETYFHGKPGNMAKDQGLLNAGMRVVLLSESQPSMGLLAAIQALCISADQEWCCQEGKISEWDKGWFLGQLHSLAMYTSADKSAIEQAREYIEKLSSAPPSCKLCNDSGTYCIGTSGDASDGNAPILERCDCDAGQPLAAAPTPDRAAGAGLRLFALGKKLEDEEIDDEQQYRIGAELIALSGICTSCHGEGQDGDAPDANGEGGWVGNCIQCDGTGKTRATKAEAAPRNAGVAPAVATFEGYVDGMPRIKWTGAGLPAGAELFAAPAEAVTEEQAQALTLAAATCEALNIEGVAGPLREILAKSKGRG